MSKLTISTKPFGKDKSKFYSEFSIKLPTTFVLNDFSYEQLKIVEKFSLDRLFQLDRFAEGYYKFEKLLTSELRVIVKIHPLWILSFPG